jgi:hypothetical protein
VRKIRGVAARPSPSRAVCRYIFLTETATNVVRVVARCATTDGGMWVGLVSDLAPRSHSRRIAHTLVGVTDFVTLRWRFTRQLRCRGWDKGQKQLHGFRPSSLDTAVTRSRVTGNS